MAGTNEGLAAYLTNTIQRRYRTAVLADTPVGYWRMDAPSGTTETDLGSGGHDGAYSGSPTQAQPGALAESDTAIVCASVGKMTVAAAAFSATAFTVEAWVKFTATDLAQMVANEVFIATQQTAGTSGWRLGAHKFAGEADPHLAFWTTQEGGTVKVEAADVPSPGVWYHVAITYDGTTYRLYVNGALAAQGTGTLVADAGSVIFGHISSTESLDGALDECATYSAALSATRIAAHYALSRPADVTTMLTSRLNALTGEGTARVKAVLTAAGVAQ